MESKSFLEKFRIDGKVALVTGGSRGIGKAIALALAEAGADVALASRKLPELEATAEEIRKMGRKAVPMQANVRHLPEIDNLVKKAMEEFGRIDILINNAGTNPTYDSIFNMDEPVWDIIMGLNLKGYFFLSQAVAKIMRDQGGGTIVNTSSEGGITPAVGLGTYSISKAGVIMLTKVLAQELGKYNIRVNAIAPGVIRTKLSKALWSDPIRTKETINNTALGRIAEPEEMAGAVLFFASEASSYVTGQTILLDGGGYASVQAMVKALDEKK